MPIDNTIDLTIEELKTIIHALRMSTLAFVEESAIDEIEAMIKALPLPEQVDQMSVNHPISLKRLQKDIGNIMRIIELYGKRDVEFKTRYKSRTGLPPRYKVLDRRSKMKPEVKASVKEMMKISSDLDNKGFGEISGSINKFASKIVKEEFDNTEYEKISAALKNSKLEKEAQFWQGVKEMGKGLANWGRGVGQSAKEMYQVGKYKASLSQIAKQIQALIPEITKAYQGAQDPARKQNLGNISQMLQNMAKMSTQVYKIVEEEEKKEAIPASAPASAPTGTSASGDPTVPAGVDPGMWGKFQEWMKTQTPAPAATPPAISTPGA